MFISWGVRTVGETAKPFTPAEQETYPLRKVREGELKTARERVADTKDTKINKATERDKVSLSRDLPWHLLTKGTPRYDCGSLQLVAHLNLFSLPVPRWPRRARYPRSRPQPLTI